jgi:hypothetical protein
MADDHTTAHQEIGVDPTSGGLHSRCNHCHLLRRTCRNGITTRPCDRCREKGVLCTFTAPGSFVDKHVPGRGVRNRVTNRVVIVPGKCVNWNGSFNSIIDQNFQAGAHHNISRTVAVKPLDVNSHAKQKQTLVEEPKVEEIQMEEPNPYMAQSSKFCIFTHEQIYSQQESMMDAAEDLTARQKLGYELMAKHE